MSLVIPDLLYENGAFVSGRALDIDLQTGRIRDVLPAPPLMRRSDGRSTYLPRRAVLPGFVNAHSHAFQRLIRGRTQWKPPAENSDFWSWRSAMYDALLRLSPTDIYDVSRWCFVEMLHGGITSVGE